MLPLAYIDSSLTRKESMALRMILKQISESPHT